MAIDILDLGANFMSYSKKVWQTHVKQQSQRVVSWADKWSVCPFVYHSGYVNAFCDDTNGI